MIDEQIIKLLKQRRRERGLELSEKLREELDMFELMHEMNEDFLLIMRNDEKAIAWYTALSVKEKVNTLKSLKKLYWKRKAWGKSSVAYKAKIKKLMTK